MSGRKRGEERPTPNLKAWAEFNWSREHAIGSGVVVNLRMYKASFSFWIGQLMMERLGSESRSGLLRSNGLVIVADLPEEWVVERLADMLGEVYAEEHPQLTSRGSALKPRPAFTYHFPQQDEASSFAVRPSDPRYYQEVRALPDIVTVPDFEVAKEPEEPQTTTTTTTTTTTLAPELSERDQDTESGVSRSLIPATIDDTEDIYFIAIVAGCSAAAVLAVVGIGIAWYKWHRNTKAAADVEYPAYGVTGPNKDVSPTGDRRLAHSAQMYHYQHQKQQILAMETSSRATSERNGSLSEADSEEENEEGDYTVYECPGPAPIGEMEVRNPLFLDDPTPATQAPTNPNSAATK
uniref:Neural proliferation differentiation and control protein 1 n=1 Tax=Timema genevievae TaxID=629358 RepID=A0A7R9PGL3_TIMGE|nr:unnamed protein product [Timema genevievae]